MAVFLVNQCTFSKIPTSCADQQANQGISNGASPSNQNSNDSTSNLSVASSVGLSSSNICGLKFDSLFELIHHIEDNHITDVDYPGITPIPFYNGHQHQHQQPQHWMDANIYNINPHERHHMTQIINGGWLPTSCILRIFNSTHKPPKQQQLNQQPPHPPPTHQLMHKLQAPQHHLQQAMQTQQIKYETGLVMNQSQDSQQQATNVIAAPLGATHMQPQMTALGQTQMQPQAGIRPQQMIAVQSQAPMQPQQMPQQQLTVDMMAPSPQICTTPIDSVNSHHIILASPKIVGNLNGASFHVTSGAITASQPNVATITSIAPQQAQQQQPQTQSQPNQIINNNSQQTQNIGNSIQSQPNVATTAVTPVSTPKPTKVYKCTDCTKTYKTVHGLRTHQTSQHQNSPHTDVKTVATMPESGDISSRSPAPLSQQQQQQQQQQQPQPQQLPTQQQQQPMTVEMVSQSPQICPTPGIESGGNSHHIILASPKIVGNLNGASYHVSSGALTTPQTNVTTVTSVAPTASQTIINNTQQVSVNNSIQQQQLQLQPTSQQQQTTPQQQQTQPTPVQKPTKVYKCTDCTKTYKTMHGLRTHQSNQHPTSPQTDSKAMAIMPEGGDTPSGSPADLPQHQQQNR